MLLQKYVCTFHAPKEIWKCKICFEVPISHLLRNFRWWDLDERY